MMAQQFPSHPGMAPGHPGMPHHPMSMQHPGGGHMGGQPGPGVMQAMHPGVSGPQVTQGPMVTGMPPGAGTPAPGGGPMHNGAMAMAHLGPQQPMFAQHNPQMNFGQMPMQQTQQQIVARQLRLAQLQQQQQNQQHGMQMNMPNGAQNYNPAQIAQMKMGIPMQQQLQMQAANPQAHNLQQHQRMMMQAQAQNAAIAASQRAAAQMAMSRSQQEQQSSQPPQSQPTPAPQNQAQAQPQPTSQPQQQSQPQQSQPKQQTQQQTNNNPQQQSQTTTPAKQNEQEEEPQMKQQQDLANAMMMQEMPKPDFNGNCILQLILYQNSLASPDRPLDLDYWDDVIRKYFSPYGSIRQQVFSNKSGVNKSFQLQFPSLARFYHAHFASGVKQILLQSYDHNQNPLPNGGMHIWSQHATLTYVFSNDIRVTTSGALKVSFNDLNKIEHLYISTEGWQEYIPRTVLIPPVSPDQKQSPKQNKNAKRAPQKSNGPPVANIPSSSVGEFGVPQHIIQFLEIAEVMTAMAPLMDFQQNHPGIAPRESLMRVTQENQQHFTNMPYARAQNQLARAANGQVFPNQMHPGMNGPNQFASPGMAHLGLPQAQGSPHIGGPVHTPSPAHNPVAGGVAMMHQMSAQGSNLSGSQGASTNTSPNASTKRRRPSASTVKMEDANSSQDANGANKVKPSPRIGGKKQKAAA